MRESRTGRGVPVVVASLSLIVVPMAMARQDAPPPQPAATPVPAPAQAASSPASPASSPAAGSPAAMPAPPSAGIGFNFKGAPWEQVLDFFARSTGLPIVKEAPVPDGVVDYLSPKTYSLTEALEVLNTLLQTRGVMLRAEADKLYLAKLEDMKRENIPTYVGKLPATVTSDQIVTFVMPLRNAAAKPLAEQLALMVAAYGSVTAMEKQNALIIVETAAQVRRLEQIVAELDKEDAENVVEYIPIRHAKASEMVASLTALMGERVVEYVINPQNNQKVKLEENRLGGMTIAADPRTNAIVARGTRAKIEQLRETIALLDVPGADDMRAMRTFVLRRLTAAEAATQLTQLFSQLPPKERPTILPSPDGFKLTLIGSDGSVAEAASLLREIDPPNGLAAGDDAELANTVAVVALSHAAPDAALATAKAMLGRQGATLTMSPGADGRSVVLAGPASQLQAAKAILEAIDRPGRSDRQVRLVRLAGGDPKATLERAEALFREQLDQGDPRAAVSATLDASTRSAVLVGEPPALAKFAAIVDQLQSALGPQPDVRMIPLEHAKAAEVAAFLDGLANGPLGAMVDNAAPGAGKPLVEPIAATNSLLVAAQPAQQQVIAALVRTVDVPQETALPPLRILQLRTADAVGLASTLNATYAKRTSDERGAKPVSITADAQTNTLLVAAHPDLLPEIEQVVEELNETNRTQTEGREIRIFPLRVARATELAETIDEMFPPPPVPVDPRGRPRPELQKPREVVVRADAGTNALIVDAPVQRMAGFQELVESLDRQELGVETQIRTWRLQHADANAAAQAIRQLADSGTLGAGGGGRRTPITVTVEPATKTLVVAGPSDIFSKVDEVLRGLDERTALPSTTLRFFKLVSAKADLVAPMLREILAARLVEEGGPADLQALLKVTADRKTNTLIVSAPDSIMAAAEELVKQLDSSTSAGVDEPIIRVRPLTFADAREVSTSLGQAIPGLISKATGEPVNVKLVASASSNALILVGPEADLKEVDALIEPLDSRPTLDAVDARSFELRHAEATRIAPLVQNLLADQQETDPRIVLERLRRSRGQLDTTPRVRVEADARTNRLIVSGPQRVVALAETLISELDRADEGAQRTIATFTPTNGDAATLAQTAARIVEQVRPSGQRATLTIVPEPQSGALLLVGTPGEVEQAVGLLKSWDAQAMVAPAMDLKLVALRHADARIVAPAVAGLLGDRTRWPEALRAAAKAGVGIGQPTVTADPQSNRLLVSAPTPLLPLAERMIAELDQPRDGGAALEVRTFSLVTADAKGAAEAIRGALDARGAASPGEPKASVVAEPSSNAVVVTASPEQLRQVEAIIDGLDAGAPRDQAQIRTVFLKHGRASEVAPLVEKLLADKDLIDPKGLPPWAQAEYMRVRKEVKGTRPEVRVAADERLNAIVVAAPAAVLDAAEAVVAQLDAAPAGDDATRRSVRLLALRNADASAVATSLDAIFADEKELEKPPTIRVDAASNSLLVRASEAQFATIERVVDQIDDASMTVNRQVTTVPIDGGKMDAREVAEMLRRLVGGSEAAAGARGGGSKVEVITLEELLRREAAKGAPAGAAAPGPRTMRTPAGAAPLHAAVATSIFAVVAPPAPPPAPPAAPTNPADGEPEVTIAVDERTNSLVIVGSPRSVERLVALAKQAQEQVPAAPTSLRVITLDRDIDPERLRNLVSQILARMAPPGGKPGDLAKRVAVLADADLNALVVAASDRDFPEIVSILAAVGKAPVSADLPVRTITLERASAGPVAQAIQRFYDERAKLIGGSRTRRDARRVAVVGDGTSNTLLVAAADDDFAEVQRIVEQLDSPQAASALELRIFPLKHARAGEIERTVQTLVGELTWNQPFFMFGGQRDNAGLRRDTVAVRAEPRLNALLVTGTGDKFKLVEELVDTLDAPPSSDAAKVVKLYPIRNASVDLVAQVVRDAASAREPRPWESSDGGTARVRVDSRTRTLIVVGTESQQKEIAGVLAGLDRPAGARPQSTEVVRVEYARAVELADVLREFLQQRSASAGEGEPTTTIVPTDSANTLLVAGDKEDVATLRDLVAKLDQPGTGGDRRIEIVALRESKADELAQLLSQQFPRGASGAGGVVVTPDVRTNTLVINAPPQVFPQVKALVEQLDHAAIDDATVIRTYALSSARADEVARLLTQSLQLDERGETPTEGAVVRLDDPGSEPVRVRARVVADRRSNSIVVSATPESFPVIEALVNRLDDVPAKSPVEYRLVKLKHAMAIDVSYTLRQVVRGSPDDPAPRIDYDPTQNTLVIAATADQFEQIDAVLTQIDQPSERRRQTEFVALKFADAEKVREALQYFYGPRAIDADTPGKQSVVIVADPASSSLVISADESEWEGIRGLVSKLDSAEYDASQQLRVYALLHADAASVARAINEAFQGRFDQSGRVDAARRGQPAPGAGNDNDPRRQSLPAVLVASNEWVNAAPESQTNSVVVSASRQNLQKIERIIEQIDTPDFAKLPPPRVIPVLAGNPVQLAETLVRMFAPDASERGGRSARGLRIAGDLSTSTIIVRASDEEFAQIEALAAALQQETDRQGLAVKVLPMKSAPAARVAAALREAFAAKARQQNLPFSIAVDSASNALVVASTGPLFEEIKATVAEMDRLAPTAGQAIFVIDLQNIAPEAAKSVIESIGLDKPQPEASAARLVVEPVKVSLLPGRRAIVVVASPADKETIVGLLKVVDAEPALAESRMRIVRLRNAEAPAVAALLNQILTPSPQQASTALAKAVAEQVRRLNVRRDGLNEPDLNLDLATPIRIVPDAGLNAIVLASTPENVAALEELVKTFDTLPVTDEVTVQIFPLENIAAEQFARIVRELFQQGKTLATRPGGRAAAGALVPAGVVGKALLDSVAITVDDRTNTVVVAGKEDSVALVEVLVKRLDGEVAAGWVEPRVLPLRFADAEELATTLQALLADGAPGGGGGGGGGGAGGSGSMATPLQKQMARLRVMRQNGGQVPAGDAPIEADFFQPMTRTVIKPEPNMNALVVVATPANLEVIAELVRMLDVDAASPAASVRVYPIQHASAAKLAATIQRVFEQQFTAKAIRAEDRVAAQSDERTNSLVVSTSPRSFAVLEALLKTLDSPLAPDLREIRTIEVTSASAQRLAPMIQQLMDARLERLRKVQPETADLEKVLVIPDARSNALVVSAAADAFEVVKRLVADLDSSTVVDTSMVHVITLEKANADRIAAAIRSILERRYADLPPEVRSSQRPLVLVDQRSNSLLVAAADEDVRMIGDLARKLEDAPVNPAVGVNVVPLLAGRAETLAPRLESILQQRRASLGAAATPGDLVSIQPDPASNALIVAASDENLQTIRQLVEVLGKVEAESGGQSFEILPLLASRAGDLLPVLNEMYVAEENRRRGANSVRVVAEPRLNAVLVTGDVGDVEAVKQLVARLDGAQPETVVEIKYVPLAGGNAIEMVALLESILSGRGLNGRAGRAATVLKYFGGDGVAGGEATVSTAIRESINLTPDVRTNTIIVSAPRDSMAMIERMIRDLDASTTGAQNIRIFKLVNADAQAMSEILRTLFNLEQRGDLLVLKPREAIGLDVPAPGGGGLDGAPPAALPATGFPGLGGVELTAVPDERQQLSITIDSRTNSLLVSATPTYLDLVEKVVKELDAQEANEREINIYKLKNAVAAEVARVVNDFVEQDQRKLIDTLGTDQLPSAARLLEREVTIVGDVKTNTLLINASPRYMSKVEQMIRELDIDPPQVLIQVLLAEISLDATDEMGVDLNVSIDAGDYTIGGGYGLASVAAASIGMPTVPLANIPFVSVAGPDFNMLIRAMQSQGRVQVLSNPSVMAANNEVANIQIGETVRLPESVSFAAGQQQSSVIAEDIGIILKVTPSINPDGFVRMDVNPEISELSTRTTQISEDFFSPVITRRRANTTVTVKDGETVVIGGLISDRYEKVGNKVPLLGDIPVLGFFFRRDAETVRKTELLIVLTPHVVMAPSELHVERARSLSQEQIDRLSLPEYLKEQIRKGQLEGVGGLYDADGKLIEPAGINRLEPSETKYKQLRDASGRGFEAPDGPQLPPPGPQSERQQDGSLP